MQRNLDDIPLFIITYSRVSIEVLCISSVEDEGKIALYMPGRRMGEWKYSSTHC
jgi:hypothetical protein